MTELTYMYTATYPEGTTEEVEVTTQSIRQDASETEPSTSLLVSYYVIGLLGVFGNFGVIVVLLSSSHMRKKLTNIYILNQSSIDIMTSVFLLGSATIKTYVVPYEGIAGQIYCQLWLTRLPLWSFLDASTYNLLSLTVERYLEVIHPIWHKIHFGKSLTIFSLVFPWFIGLAYNVAFMIPTSVIEDGVCLIYGHWPSLLTQQVFGILTVVVQYIFPLIVLIYCYARIVMVMQKKIKVEPEQTGQNQAPQNEQQQKRDARWRRAKTNTIKTLLIVALSFVMCWSWNQVYFGLYNLGYNLDFSNAFYHFTVVAVFCNCCVNPFIYTLKYEQFQNAARKLFCGLCLRQVDNSFDSTTETVNTVQTAKQTNPGQNASG